ncbi:MAG: PQQ-binding-like beta-propeller repeat protein [Lentisphaerae bacterium]|jgi:outer membrane protein assembly factor BamB|nr:PQQ-binding-like beta-propeller repeat protein [Lentisphaerota bacterium]MBT4817930.1 PQQ-binding-like beta-propeller repeat protein [Lentisphaerota bacterium]MBT5613054.1 PQQ-binding-like beta-propeller repeat protein [Lentisphaerota bacterium]MBT7053981.1 PQQ-binding-like beta-propeller repeat protein [Lentisphaerota bacterium]MBT7843782.1 PQQ-binding-like beta-propeller repeat protein [Lentisphaerota bacterium]
MTMIWTLRVVSLVALLSFSSRGADWPQYRGPERSGVSRETGLARAWPESGPTVTWTLELGRGYGSPAVRGNEVYILDRPTGKPADQREDVLRCLDLDTGKELWSFAYAAPGRYSFDGTRSVPTVTDGHVYLVGPFGHAHCVDRKTHKAVWSVNLLERFGGDVPRWGFVQSPLLDDDVLIVAPQGKQGFLVGLDAGTGETRWASPPLSGRSCYASPVVATLAGVRQVVIATGGQAARGRHAAVKGTVAAFAAEDGRLLWTYDGWQCRNPIADPVPVDTERVFIAGGYGAGAVMLRVVKADGGLAVEEASRVPGWKGQIQTPILHDGVIYANNSGKGGKGGLTCLSLDGKTRWASSQVENGPVFDRGGVLVADGLIFAVDVRGSLRMVEANPEEYRELGSVPLLAGKEIWAPLALSNGRLFLRDLTKMHCVDLRAK